jgi:hypothetical protein
VKPLDQPAPRNWLLVDGFIGVYITFNSISAITRMSKFNILISFSRQPLDINEILGNSTLNCTMSNGGELKKFHRNLVDCKKINCLSLDYTVYLIPMFKIKWVQMYLWKSFLCRVKVLHIFTKYMYMYIYNKTWIYKMNLYGNRTM